MLDPAPLYGLKPIKFRMADIAHGECSASECSLVANDYWAAGYGRIITVPRVKLAYDKVRLLLPCGSYSVMSLTRLLMTCNRKYMIPCIPAEGTSPPSVGIHDLAVLRTTRAQILRIARGTVLMTVCSCRRRVK